MPFPSPVDMRYTIGMKRWQKIILILIIALALAFVAGELLARMLFPASSSYQTVITQDSDEYSRLLPAGWSRAYDIRGLYEGAETATERVSANQFIEPEPGGDAPFQILFLGGSTTEAQLVPEADRFVAHLNALDGIDAYNAARSGSNTVDMIHTFDALTEKGWHFDLVVLMTPTNDYGWLNRFRRYDLPLRYENYVENLQTFYAQDKAENQTLWENLQDRSRFIDLLTKFVEQSIGGETILGQLQRQQAEQLAERQVITLGECGVYPGIVATYAQNAEANLMILAEKVVATDAILLVLSEANSYAAPSESFAHDLRVHLPCGDDVLTYADSAQMYRELNDVYLGAAEMAGAETFDLAGAMAIYLDSPDGGKYMYDSIHYSAAGSRLVAEVLEDVLKEFQTRLSE